MTHSDAMNNEDFYLKCARIPFSNVKVVQVNKDPNIGMCSD